MKVELQLAGEPSSIAERVRDLAALGPDGVFTFEGRHDVFLPLAVAAQSVDADLMTNIAVALPRSPVHLAHLANDLQLMSHGRFRLGLGSQVRAHIENRYGSVWSKPAARMREIVLAIKAIQAAWQGEKPLRFEGEFTRHTLMPAGFSPAPNPYGPPPVYLGALGPLMTRMAAEVADGLLVMPFNSAKHLAEHTLPAIDQGLALSERDRSDFTIIPQVNVAVGRTPEQLEAALRGVRQQIAFYGSTPAYRSVLEVEGAGDLQPQLNQLSKTSDLAGMSALISDDLVARLAVVGDPESCADQIVARFGSFADRVCCYFPGYEPKRDDIADMITRLHGGPHE